MKNKVILDHAAEKLAHDTSKSPFLYELPIDEGRKKLEDLQNQPVYKYPVTTIKIDFRIDNSKCIPVYTVVPFNCNNIHKVIFYTHGAGWVYGSFHTHEKLVRELCARTNSIVIFPEYTRSPEAKYPTAIKECYKVLCEIPSILNKGQLNIKNYKLIVAGDSVGGNMAAVMTLLSKFYNGPKICKQLLYYPVTNDDFNTSSYNEFENGYYLSKKSMEYFWNQYTKVINDRNKITASPLKASITELSRLPDAMIINGEADVLRDEGESYATKLMEAGVNVTQVRIKGTIHDFVMLNALDRTNACRTAMNISVDWINQC